MDYRFQRSCTVGLCGAVLAHMPPDSMTMAMGSPSVSLPSFSYVSPLRRTNITQQNPPPWGFYNARIPFNCRTGVHVPLESTAFTILPWKFHHRALCLACCSCRPPLTLHHHGSKPETLSVSKWVKAPKKNVECARIVPIREAFHFEFVSYFQEWTPRSSRLRLLLSSPFMLPRTKHMFYIHRSKEIPRTSLTRKIRSRLFTCDVHVRSHRQRRDLFALVNLFARRKGGDGCYVWLCPAEPPMGRSDRPSQDCFSSCSLKTQAWSFTAK